MESTPKATPGAYGSRGGFNYVPYPPTPMNPKTGQLYTQEELNEYVKEQREKRQLYHDIWYDYTTLYDTKYRYQPNAINIYNNQNSRRVKQYAQTLHRRNVYDLDTYTAKYWPDLISIKKDIDRRMKMGYLSKDKAQEEWERKRSTYMWDVVESEYLKQKRAALAQSTPRVTGTPMVFAADGPSPSPWNTWMSKMPTNPLLTGQPKWTPLSVDPPKSASNRTAAGILVTMKGNSAMNFQGGTRKKKGHRQSRGQKPSVGKKTKRKQK
jgi:hypothetical protein